MNGAERICATLQELGVGAVFGLPGTQNLLLYDALRRSGLRSVAATDEAAAAFMASGYARASGSVGVVTTIPGPGFVYALAGIAEAQQDSVPLLWLTLKQADDGQAFPLQRIDQTAMAAPVVKQCFRAERPDELGDILLRAHQEAMSDEPGPVLVEVATPLLLQVSSVNAAPQAPVETSWTAPPSLIERLRSAARPVIYVGQGAQRAAGDLQQLARNWRAPVLFTSSGRGVLPDCDELAFVRDFSCGIGEALPDLLERADLIFVLGCKFTHNGSAAGRLRLPSEKLVRVDASPSVLAANYPASIAICAHAEEVVVSLLAAGIGPSQWSAQELADRRSALQRERDAPIEHEPTINTGVGRASVAQLFDSTRRALGRDVIYTTDAGLHQALVRKYPEVTTNRGLLCPSDFQSMGFGLPGAIGAALARPGSMVVACIGDGAFALSLGEMLTAVREGVDVIVVVFNDGAYGLIRRQQLQNFGHSVGTDLHSLDYAALAAAIGCSYFPLAGDIDVVMATVARTPGVRLVEVRLDEAASLGWHGLKSAIREKFVRSLPDGTLQVLKRTLRS